MVPFMTNNKILKVDYDILFKKIQTQSENGQMDFYGFIEAFEIIVKRLYIKTFSENKREIMHEVVDKVKKYFSIKHTWGYRK